MKLPSQRINTDKLKNYYKYLTGIQCTPFDESSEISVLIRANNPMLHMYTEARVGKENEPVALKTKLGWVIFGGNKNNKTLSVNAFSTECNLDEMVSKFCEIKWYGVSEKQSSSILPEIEQRALNILQETTVNKNSRYTVGRLWDSDNVLLTDNKNIALSRLFSLERKFINNPQLAERYKEAMEDYISKGHTTKLNQTDSETTSRITNYIPHHAITNVNKPSNVQIFFEVGAKAKGKSSNEHLLRGSDFLNNLVGVLLKFRGRQFAIIGDITQMFHQVQVLPVDRDTLRFLGCFSKDSTIDTYKFNVHLFGKMDSPCYSNWALRKTALDNQQELNENVVNVVLKRFYMDDYLYSFDDP